jgi:ADP-ribose pyrophosphatase YjhB (NUDIX family)
VADPRSYPDRPYLAVSAAIIRDGHVLVVRRARPPARGLFTLPGGAVEAGETLGEAIIREVREETDLSIAPVALAGYREVIEARWLRPAGLAALATTEGLADIVAAAFERLEEAG